MKLKSKIGILLRSMELNRIIICRVEAVTLKEWELGMGKGDSGT